MGREVSGALGDVPELEKPYEADDEVPDAGHDVGAVALPYLASVFIEGNIPYPVEPVLYFPMPPVDGKNTFGRIFNACDTVGHVMAMLPAFHKKGGPFYPEDCLPIREVDIPLKLFACPYLSCLYPAVRFICIGMIRGGKPPSGGLRCRCGGFPDCP